MGLPEHLCVYIYTHVYMYTDSYLTWSMHEFSGTGTGVQWPHPKEVSPLQEDMMQRKSVAAYNNNNNNNQHVLQHSSTFYPFSAAYSSDSTSKCHSSLPAVKSSYSSLLYPFKDI